MWRVMTRSLVFGTALLLPSLVLAHPDHGLVAGEDLGTIAVKTGSGAHSYETVPGWGGLPGGQNVGPTHGGVAVDKAGHVYVSTDAEHAILVFGADGSFKKSIAKECAGTHGLTIRSEGDQEFLYGAHLRGKRIVKLSLDGEIVLEIPNDNTGEIPGGMGGLTGIAVGPDGSIYASCGYGSNQVHKFDPTGKLVKSSGGRGKEDGQFMTCHGLVLDDRKKDDPKLLVMDRENRRLVHLTLDLEWVGVHTTGLRRPCSASIHGDFCAVAELEARVAIVGPDGKVAAVVGDNPDKKQWANFGVPANEMQEGIFTAPHGVSYDRDGNLYVQDWNKTGRVTKLIKTGATAGQ